MEMLGKRGVSGVFIGGVRASPRSDGGSKSEIRGYGGLKYTVPPFTKCGVSKGEGGERLPSGVINSLWKQQSLFKNNKLNLNTPEYKGTRAQDAPSSRVFP